MKPTPVETEVLTSRGESLDELRRRAREWAGWEPWIVEVEVQSEESAGDSGKEEVQCNPPKG